jgi:hypothetical protein
MSGKGDNIYLNLLPEGQQKLFDKLSEQAFINDFYLAGGTSLALQIGHRQSLDFDFFIPADFNTSALINKLVEAGNYIRENEETNTINGSLDGINISFFGYKYRIIDDFRILKGIRLAGLKDIAAMKLEAVAGRGSRKDFVDMFFLLKIFTLEEMLIFHSRKYGTGLSNQYHLIKSLVYFNDAEPEPMPRMVEKVKWNEVKKTIKASVKCFKLF